MVSDITYDKIQVIMLVAIIGLLIYIILYCCKNNSTQTPSPSVAATSFGG